MSIIIMMVIQVRIIGFQKVLLGMKFLKNVPNKLIY